MFGVMLEEMRGFERVFAIYSLAILLLERLMQRMGALDCWRW